MTPEQFKDARKTLCYSQQALADEWGMGAHGARTIRRGAGRETAEPCCIVCDHAHAW